MNMRRMRELQEKQKTYDILFCFSVSENRSFANKNTREWVNAELHKGEKNVLEL